MKKVLFVLFGIVTMSATLRAQKPVIEKSVEFDEPEFGWNKLLQLKNGNTFYFHSTKKDGIEVSVYDKKRKLISTKTLVGKIWDESKMKSSQIKGLYEIKGEPVIFLVQPSDREPVLYRLRMDANSGAISKEEELGSLPKVNILGGYAMVYGHVEPTDIIVEKDPESDCYAVIYFNSFAHNRDERIKVVHYDGSHKVLNTALLESPGGQFKYMSYIGAVVDGAKRVFVTTYGHNGNSGDKSTRIIVSRLTAGDTNFTHKLLDFSEDFKDTKSIMLYNHNNNTIQLLTLTVTNKKGGFGGKTTTYYLPLISYLDPESLELTGVKVLAGHMVTTYGIRHIDKDYEFSGLPEQMVINKDNTTTILSEESRTETNKITTTFLGPIGISELNDTGAEVRGYAISKKQAASGEFPKLYVSGRSKGLFRYSPGIHGYTREYINQFMSFDYMSTATGRYVIFNDLPGNFEKDEDEEKRKAIKSVSATNTICYELKDGKMNKYYLFGEPDGKSEGTFCYIASSDFNKDLNTYATMIVERDGRSKASKIAWVTFK